jgi:hypothetical protein
MVIAFVVDISQRMNTSADTDEMETTTWLDWVKSAMMYVVRSKPQEKYVLLVMKERKQECLLVSERRRFIDNVSSED